MFVKKNNGVEFNRKSIKKCQQIHARKRFRQRTGLSFGKKTEKYFIEQINGNKAELIKGGDSRNPVYSVCFKEDTYNVVYDRKHRTIVTVLV